MRGEASIIRRTVLRMEGLWGLLGLPAPAYASLQSHDGDNPGVDFVSRSPDSQSLDDDDDDVVHLGHIDDSLSALLHEDHTLWMLRTMFECLEMTPNGSLFLTPPDKMPKRRTPPSPTEAEKQAQRARVNRQISQAVDDKRRAREAQADVLALFGTTGLHEENILRSPPLSSSSFLLCMHLAAGQHEKVVEEDGAEPLV